MTTDRIYEDIFERLMDGRLAAGARISISETARNLGVSQTPVREALARIESTGLVCRVAMSGYRVPPPLTPQEFADFMNARLAIEPMNAEAACLNTSEEFTGELHRIIERQKSAPRGAEFSNFRDYLLAEEQFHRSIAVQAGNPFLLRAYNSLGGQAQRFRSLSKIGVSDSDSALAEHDEIAAAMERGNPSYAYHVMFQHIANTRDRAVGI